MKPPSRTVEARDEDTARELGARDLGLSPEDVQVFEFEHGLYRVQATRAVGTVEVALRPGDMEAVVTSIASSTGETVAPTRADIEVALAQIGVVAGLLLDEIDVLGRAGTESHAARDEIVIARGTEPLAGEDGEWTCEVEEGQLVRPKDVLLTAHEATPGEAGRTVTGATIVPKPGTPLPKLEVGTDVSVAEKMAQADRTGYATLDANGRWSITPLVTVAENAKRAYVDLRDSDLDQDEVLDALREAGVVYGVTLDPVWKLFHARGSLPRPVVAAVWTPPIAPSHVEVEWHVGRRSDVHDAEGRVDFRRRGGVCSVVDGQALVTSRYRTQGVDGRRVDGSLVPACDEEGVGLRAGVGVKVSTLEDGRRHFAATRDGVLRAEKEVLSVIDRLVVEGDVGYATGNLVAGGSIKVKGDVQEGFEVSAGGDIVIEGSIEAGTVECNGRLTVNGTVIGGADTHISGTLGVHLNHVQNACVRSESDVQFGGSDTGSEVTCHGRLEACNGPGLLRGGTYCATRGLRAKELGSTLGAPTRVHVGPSATLRRELAALKLALAEVKRTSKKVRRTTRGESALRDTRNLSPATAASVRRVVKARRAAIGTEAALCEQRRRLEQALTGERAATVDVEGTAHPGVEITIDEAKLVLNTPFENVRFTYDPETREIIACPLK